MRIGSHKKLEYSIHIYDIENITLLLARLRYERTNLCFFFNFLIVGQWAGGAQV